MNWNGIDTVLLDMDGTLLDRHFDDHFWLDHLPRIWGEKNRVPLDEAKNRLHALFRSQEGTLNWTDLDYWSSTLGLDVPLLKEEIDHLIAVHPFVTEFLQFLRQSGKKAWLVTNAHSKTLALKMKKTRLGPYFTGIVSAHQVGLPKEDFRFWQKLQEKVPYEPATALLAEDSEANLVSAEKGGIGHLVYVSRCSSVLPAVPSARYRSIQYFSELIPLHPQERPGV